MAINLKNLLLGSPIPNAKEEDQKLGLFSGFAILSSNALSSVAYATGEIFIVLAMAGAIAISTSAVNVAILVVLLILLMGFSYMQVIKAHPGGGGSYAVVKDSFGEKTLLLTSASLIIDYVLTVAVSVSTASLAIVSAFPQFSSVVVSISLCLLALLTLINLRGVKSTAKIFVWPTYLFVLSIVALIGVGLYQYHMNTLGVIEYTAEYKEHIESSIGVLTITLILRAFSSGSAALTGIESYANGVPNYKSPVVSKAILGLLIMTILSVIMFFGVTFLGAEMHLLPDSSESVLSQIAHQIFGDGLAYYFVQTSTCLILLMAANSCFMGFPRLASIMSGDGYLPKQLQSIGDRLAFKNGILLLALLSAVLIILFRANVTELIPLYAFGVFIAFTLCQAGLVRFWYANKKSYKSWWLRAFINAIGCIATFAVLVTIIESKFFHGVGIVILVIIMIMFILHNVKKHYLDRDKALTESIDEAIVQAAVHENVKPKIILLVSRIHKGTIEALQLARNLSDDIIPVFVSGSDDKIKLIKEQWKSFGFNEKLLVLRPVYNSFIAPVLQTIHKNDVREEQRGYSIIIIPEVVNTKWWQFLLHNQNSRMLRLAITAMDRKDKKTEARVVISVPYKAE